MWVSQSGSLVQGGADAMAPSTPRVSPSHRLEYVVEMERVGHAAIIMGGVGLGVGTQTMGDHDGNTVRRGMESIDHLQSTP